LQAPVVVKLTDQIDLSWVGFQSQLLAFESRIDQLNNLSGLTINPSANFASKAEYRGNKHGTRGNLRGSNFRAMRGGRWRGKMPKPIRQVCNKIGHTVVQCFYRFDKFYTRSNNYDEILKQGTHSAFISLPDYGQDYVLYFDSGANNHVTHQSNGEKLKNIGFWIYYVKWCQSE
jgi:hypothetical protein